MTFSFFYLLLFVLHHFNVIILMNLSFYYSHVNLIFFRIYHITHEETKQIQTINFILQYHPQLFQ